MPRRKSKVCEDDRAFALALLAGVKSGDAKEVAKVISAIHDRAVSCASIRLEREYGLVQRALPAVLSESTDEETK